MATLQKISLSDAFKKDMFEHAVQEAPNECCGMLLGRGTIIERVVPVPSVPPAPDAYYMDPCRQVEAFTEMQQRGESLIGIYHSHPAGPLDPSGVDLQLAFHPEAVYFIISLEDTQQPKIAAFVLDGGIFKEIKINDI